MSIGDYPRTGDFNNRNFDPVIFRTPGGVIEEAEEERSHVLFPVKPELMIPAASFRAASKQSSAAVAASPSDRRRIGR